MKLLPPGALALALASCAPEPSDPLVCDAATDASGTPPLPGSMLRESGCDADLCFLEGPFEKPSVSGVWPPTDFAPPPAVGETTWVYARLSTFTSDYMQAWLSPGEDLGVSFQMTVGDEVLESNIPRRLFITIDGELVSIDGGDGPVEELEIPLEPDGSASILFSVPSDSFRPGGQLLSVFLVADGRTEAPTQEFIVFNGSYDWSPLEDTLGGTTEPRDPEELWQVYRASDGLHVNFAGAPPTLDGTLGLRVEVVHLDVTNCTGEPIPFGVVALLDGHPIDFMDVGPTIVASVRPGEQIVHEVVLENIPTEPGHRLELFELVGLRRARSDFSGNLAFHGGAQRIAVALW